jgi:hypothetical protein
MVAGAATDASGHLILADWIEEKLGLADLAGILRSSQEDPRTSDEENHTGFPDFRYRQLDGQVMLYLAGYQVWRRAAQGQKPKSLEGRVVGFYLSPGSPVGRRRWVRWLPAGTGNAALQGLWDELGKAAPVPPAHR